MMRATASSEAVSVSIRNVRGTGPSIAKQGRERAGKSVYSSYALYSLYPLQIQGDPHAIHQNRALINQILVGNIRFNEPAEGFQRADEFERLRRRLGV